MASSPISFRKSLFWLHLVAGLVAGLSITLMCLTGTALAFEKQLVAWSERDARQIDLPAAGTPRLTLDELARRVRDAKPDARPTALVVSAEPRAAVAFSLGRDSTVFANPFTGAVRTPASTAVHDFMHVMEDWHRFLALSGDQRPIGKAINGACNLAFFVLGVTGLYLWLPRFWSWRGVRAVSLFNWRLTGRARDFNWHNVIGLWSAPILIVLTLTAVPISYKWGNALVYRLVGETAPSPAGPPGTGALAPALPKPPDGARPLGREAQFAAIQNAFPAWEQITLRLAAPGGRGGPPPPRENAGAAPATARPQRPEPTAAAHDESQRPSAPQPSTFTVKLPGSWPRTATTTVTMNPFTGEILRREAFSDLTAGRQTRTWTRFLHTGEALGFFGQLVAGLASLGGCFLVYTGFALAWRRFFGRNPA